MDKDPDRAQELKHKFVMGTPFPALLKLIRKVWHGRETGSSTKLVKKNKVSFFNYFGGAGYSVERREKMWTDGVDQDGKKLTRCKNKRGEECLKMWADDEEIDNVVTRVGTSGVLAQKQVRGEEAAAVLSKLPGKIKDAPPESEDGQNDGSSDAEGSEEEDPEDEEEEEEESAQEEEAAHEEEEDEEEESDGEQEESEEGERGQDSAEEDSEEEDEEDDDDEEEDEADASELDRRSGAKSSGKTIRSTRTHKSARFATPTGSAKSKVTRSPAKSVEKDEGTGVKRRKLKKLKKHPGSKAGLP